MLPVLRLIYLWPSYDRTWFSGPDKQEILILILIDLFAAYYYLYLEYIINFAELFVCLFVFQNCWYRFAKHNILVNTFCPATSTMLHTYYDWFIYCILLLVSQIHIATLPVSRYSGPAMTAHGPLDPINNKS
jgi:hypothetical protein